uniref:Putative secreted protein n=1 Tax=Anopheles darlingi TaxID=43151 RepID=A0A2M4DD77_ANODA
MARPVCAISRIFGSICILPFTVLTENFHPTNGHSVYTANLAHFPNHTHTHACSHTGACVVRALCHTLLIPPTPERTY